MIAKVIVNVSSSNTDQYYDYIVPTEFISFAKIGSRVKVPFGNADRIIMGFILELYENNNNDSLKASKATQQDADVGKNMQSKI